MATPTANKKTLVANQNGGLDYNTATAAQKSAMQANGARLNSDSAYLGSEMQRAQQVKTDMLASGQKDTSAQDAYITKLSGISAGGAPKATDEAPVAKTGLDYATALSQANQQLDPTYQRAVQNVKTQQYQNQLNGGELASARGGAHSGLAADLQNKVNIAAAGQIGDLDAERASQAAEIAQALLQRDQDVNFRNRQQDFTEWQGKESLGLSRDQFDRGILESDRDYNRGVTESDRNYNRGVLESDRSYDYQQGRDTVTDKQWQSTFDENVRQYGLDYALQKASSEANTAQGWAGLQLDRDKFNYSKSQDAAAAKAAGSSSSSSGVISDVNQPRTAATMETYIINSLPGSKNGPAGPASPNQLQTVENMILGNPNLSEKDVIKLYQRFGIPVPQ